MGKYEITLEDGKKYMVETEESSPSKKSGGKAKKSENIKDVWLPGEEKTKKKISERPDSVERLREEVMLPYSGNLLQRGVKAGITGMKTLAVPYERLSAAVGGAGVGAQKGEGLKGALKRGIAGATGETQYRSFDPFRNFGIPEYITTPTEIFTEIAVPLKMMSVGAKLLKPITRVTDKGLAVAGTKFMRAADEAISILGEKLSIVYKPINKVAVSANQILDDVVKLPQGVVAHLEDGLGKLSTYLDDFTIEKARHLKRLLGKIRPSAYGKEQKGAQELIDDELINKAYASIKKSMKQGLKDAGKHKEAKLLQDADEAFSRADKATRYLKKTIVDPILGEETRVGRMASKIKSDSDVSGRRALNILKDVSFKTNKDITKAVDLLNKFNRRLFLIKSAKQIGRGAVYGAAAGALGGKIARGGGGGGQ